ncbi:MAG: hypothetical protein II312_13585 [Lachnospiraceae bacterium]|nr:hypothetical protein [Lachnospiraceae bacterium]MEE0919083.1 hypothetical protein [Lachnospiraceae bacterium]
MMCSFCGNRVKCWADMSDEALEMEFVKCGYDDYVLDDSIELEDLLYESERRAEEREMMERGINVG